jgi:hypothetical protein
MTSSASTIDQEGPDVGRTLFVGPPHTVRVQLRARLHIAGPVEHGNTLFHFP